MSTTDAEFAALMERVLSGDKEAAQHFHEEYGPHILRAVRKRLHPRLRSKYDSLDFVQDVWASFFRSMPDYFQFATPEDLVAFLTTIARRKVSEVVRTRLQRQKYNINREKEPIAALGHGLDQCPADQPTPSEIMMGEEAWAAVLAKQPPVYRRILVLFREGRPTGKIAEDLGLSYRTVQRALLRALGEGQT